MKLHTSLFSVGSVKGVGFEPEYISLPKRNLTLPTRVSNPTSDYMQRLRGALPRSRARGRRAQTRQHTPPAPAEQPRSHAQAPAKDDLQRPHTVTGTHGPGASSLRARRAGQRRIPGRN